MQTNGANMKNFQQLYDEAVEMPLKDVPMEALYERLEIPAHLNMTIRDASTTIKNRIRDLLLVGSNQEKHIPSYELYGLKTEWYYRDAIFDRNDYSVYYKAIDQLQYMYGAELRRFIPFAEETSWLRALSLLKGYMNLNPRSDNELTRGKNKEKDRVQAVKHMMKLGARVSFENGEMQITHVEPILRTISANIEAVGGVNCIEYILSKLTYSPHISRFLMPYYGSSLGMTKARPAIPLAYIINLAFNKVRSHGRTKIEKLVGDTIRLATDLCTAVYSAQSYSVWEDVFMEQKQFEKSFERWISQDSLYNIPQTSPAFVRDWVESLILELERQGIHMVYPYTLQDYLHMMQFLMPLSGNKTFRRLSESAILNGCGLEHDTALAILEDVTCRMPNPGYQHPLDFERVTALDYPAFRLPNRDIMLYPASLGAMGWYEVLMTQLRARTANPKRIDIEAGKALESFLRMIMSRHEISSIGGTYCVGNINGECDAIVQGEQTICLMELKKKNLTRKSREGYLYQLLMDFAGAVFYPQVQACRTEALLVQEGRLTLDDGGCAVSVAYNGRRINRISVSLNDFGPIHQQYVLDNVMKTFCNFVFSVNRDEIAAYEKDPGKIASVMAGYEELQKKQNQFEQYLQILVGIVPNYQRLLFFNSGFYSMEQLYYIISLSKGEADFIAKLGSLGSVSSGTGDFWREAELRWGVNEGTD